jgi:hypothetical protein
MRSDASKVVCIILDSSPNMTLSITINLLRSAIIVQSHSRSLNVPVTSMLVQERVPLVRLEELRLGGAALQRVCAGLRTAPVAGAGGGTGSAISVQ